MMTDTHYVLASTLLTFVMLLSASALRAKLWTPEGLKLGLGNREAMPDPSPIAARADRAAKNMLENMALFIAVYVAARTSGAAAAEVTLGAAVFFWARVAYFGAYLVGIPYVRTLIWTVAIVGIFMIGRTALPH